jgi:hypothetical protein
VHYETWKKKSVEENVRNQKEISSPRVWDKIALLSSQTLNDLHMIVNVT